MRAIPVLLCVGSLLAALAASACSSGGGNDADAYLRAVIAIESRCTSSAVATADPDTAAAEIEYEIDSLAKLHPPTEVAREHDQVIEAGRALEKWFDNNTSDLATVRADGTAQARAQSYATAEARWADALASLYHVRRFTVEGSAMSPALNNGDSLAVPVADASPITRGEIMVFTFPLDTTRDFIKRVIGLPGDTVEVKDGRVYIDATPIEEPYVTTPAAYTYGPNTVPAGQYFVLGDNRNNSYDSHAWHYSCSANQVCDFVPRDLVLGILPADATPEPRGACPG